MCIHTRTCITTCTSRQLQFKQPNMHSHIKCINTCTTSTLRKCRDELVKKVWGQGRDRMCSRTTSCPIVHKPHINIPTCGVFIVCTFTGVACGQLDMRSFLNKFHPYLVPIIFFTNSFLHFLKFFSKNF